MSEEIAIPPKTFISYSWTTPEHEEWVLQLATQLVENGVDVILDKWHLREGADSYSFMEKMVTDPDIKKVMMICDKAYAEKADKRERGVGTETQIISAEVYKEVENKKFVPIIREKDANGNAYLPTYLKSRIFIDMSDEEAESRNFEQLVRWIFDKRLHQKPELGKTPSYISEDQKISLNTSSRFRSATNAVLQNKATALGIVQDYLETFVNNFNELKIKRLPNIPFDEQVIESFDSFLPYRNEFLDLVSTIIRYSQNDNYISEIHRFFERLLPYLFTSSNQPMDRFDDENDNFRIIVKELFLCTIALLLKKHKFSWVNELLSKEYYLVKMSYQDDPSSLYSYLKINQHIPSFESRAKRLQIQTNIFVELLNNRPSRNDINFKDIMQADFLLYLRDELMNLRIGYWYPILLLLYQYSPFELFLRAESLKFFDEFKVVLGIDKKENLGEFLDQYAKGERDPLRRGYYDRIDLRIATNFERLATKG